MRLAEKVRDLVDTGKDLRKRRYTFLGLVRDAAFSAFPLPHSLASELTISTTLNSTAFTNDVRPQIRSSADIYQARCLRASLDLS